MKSNGLLFIFVILFAFSTGGCRNTVTQPDLDGSLVGFVYTFDEFANLLEDHSKVKVTAIGFDEFSTHTDTEGRFEFKNLPAGTYELQFAREGFGTLKQFGIKHLGGKPTVLGMSFDPSVNSEAFFIYRMPTTEIVNLSVEKDTITAILNFPGEEPGYAYLQVYFSTVTGFEMSDAGYVIPVYLAPQNDVYKGRIYDIRSHFQKGEEVYFIACELYRRSAITLFLTRVVGGIDSYFDFSTNTTIYPNLGNESAQYSFVLQE